jgi:hypothetical protein
MEIPKLRFARRQMERAMSFLTTSRAPAFADPRMNLRSLHLALPQQSLYSFPDPQGHLSLGFGMEHLQLWLSYIEHYNHSAFCAQKKFPGSEKRAIKLWSRACRRTRVVSRLAWQSDVICC